MGGGKILRIVPRDAWLAQPPSSDPLPLTAPVKKVIILPTRTDDCETQVQYKRSHKCKQTSHVQSISKVKEEKTYYIYILKINIVKDIDSIPMKSFLLW